MKAVSPLSFICSVLFLVGAIALSGCSADGLAGPDAPPELQRIETMEQNVAPVDGEESGSSFRSTQDDGGGGTEQGASHNEVEK